ncbi:MAG: hypothetical protein AB1758_11035 [Candidatus Eremiobacterota bacterium]
MEIVHLPPGMVSLLDALALGNPTQDDLEAFEEERQAALRWHAFHSAYSLDDEDLSDLENVALCWREVVAALEEPTPAGVLEKLLTPLYQAIHRMDQVNRRRENAHFSALPAVNDLIMAGAACIQGRGQLSGVLDRVAVAEEYYRNCRHLYLSRKSRLKPEVQPEFERALQLLREGIESVARAARAEDLTALHDALARVKDSSDLFREFLEWDRRDQERFRARHTRFHIPLVGPELELALGSGRSLPRAQWERGVRHLTETVLPRLFAFWSLVRASLVVPSSRRAQLLEAVEDALEGLDGAVSTLSDPERPAGELADSFEAACVALSAAFAELESNAVRGDRLGGTLGGVYWEAGHGALAGSVPLVALQELLRQKPPLWPEVEAGFRDYLETRRPEALCDALTALVEQFEPSAAAEPDAWGCGYCGFLNPLGQHPCRRCGANPSGTVGTGAWEA